jgi:protein-S-isoprenylcysteine O-methyltransferase Ste14
MTPKLAMTVFLIGAVIWFIIRIPARRRARKTAVKLSGRGLREKVLMAISLAGLGIVPFVYIATQFGGARLRFLDFAERPFVPALAWLGTLAFAASLWLFYRTHKDLGRNWSVSLDIRESHKLVTTGVYALVRHPMYSAFWLWAVAQALLLPNWIAGLSGIVGFGTLFFGRIGEEERLMCDAFGDEYRAYIRRTARVVPGLY